MSGAADVSTLRRELEAARRTCDALGRAVEASTREAGELRALVRELRGQVTELREVLRWSVAREQELRRDMAGMRRGAGGAQ